jgi:GT2 family glycosyltransferase
MTPQLPDVALVMPVHGTLSTASSALLALALLSPLPAQIIIVRDLPPEPNDGALLPPGAIVVEVPYASGPARARNAGATAALAELLLFVDADVVVAPDAVSRVRNEFVQQPEISALFGSYDTLPGDPGFFSQYRNLMHHYIHQRSNEVAGTFWAGLGAIRTEVFRSVGGFDASYALPSIEDIELGCRLRDTGHEIRLVKDLQGCHLKRWTLAGMVRTDLCRRGIPWMRLILARGKTPPDLNGASLRVFCTVSVPMWDLFHFMPR